MNTKQRFRGLLWMLLAILLLGGLYFGMRATLREPADQEADGRTFKLSVAAPNPGEEYPVFTATQGDTVTFVIGSDRAGEIDVHGYDKQVVVKPGGEVELTFVATSAGAFPLHLHEPFDPPAADGSMNHRYMAMLEVQPK